MRVIEHLDLLARLHYLFGIGQLGINAQFAILLYLHRQSFFFPAVLSYKCLVESHLHGRVLHGCEDIMH